VYTTQVKETTTNRTALYQQIAQVVIFIQALVATAGSLYYSTFGDPVKNFIAGNLFPYGEGLEPCVLCWFARILMYPIMILSYVGIAKQDKKFTDYVLALSVPGILLELYHYAIQKLPIPTFFTCSSTNPCNALQVNYFGFITIPFLALVAFTTITIAAVINTTFNKSNKI
jgi:disulfide bond formation protein DsbB